MFLHEMKNFKEFILATSKEMKGLSPSLIEKDYWIMHCLWGLQHQQFEFFMKGGTSLSKGFKIIDRFSEDIDILITPPKELKVMTGKNHNKKAHIDSRAKYYDYLAKKIKIQGITSVDRDSEFDDKKMRSGGLRLYYKSLFDPIEGLKDGILLEVGFAKITPNEPLDISSWLVEKTIAFKKFNEFKDNRAINVRCYNPEYTFIEKLSAISTKYKKYVLEEEKPANFLRHYYDIHQLLHEKRVIDFIGSEKYHKHKNTFFKEGERDLTKNDAFIITDLMTKSELEEVFKNTESLYYSSRPSLKEILKNILIFLSKL